MRDADRFNSEQGLLTFYRDTTAISPELRVELARRLNHTAALRAAREHRALTRKLQAAREALRDSDRLCREMRRELRQLKRRVRGDA